MNVINGQFKGVLSLQDARAIERFERFGCASADEYQSQLSTKNLADLFTIAMKNNIIPISDRGKLTRKLVDAYKKAKHDYEFIKSNQ